MRQRRTPGGAGASPGKSRAAGARANTGRSGARTPAGRLAAPVAPRAPRAGDTGRSSVRPSAARRNALPTAAAKRTRAPQPKRFTGRAMILSMVLLGLLLAYAYPVRVYLAQQAEIAALEQQVTEQRDHISDLQEQNAKWDDNSYVISQARKRLHMVLPGETPYVIIDPSAAAAPPDGAGPPGDKGKDPPWYGKLWSSIESADKR